MLPLQPYDADSATCWMCLLSHVADAAVDFVCILPHAADFTVRLPVLLPCVADSAAWLLFNYSMLSILLSCC